MLAKISAFLLAISLTTHVVQSVHSNDVVEKTRVTENTSKSNYLGTTNYIRSQGRDESRTLSMNDEEVDSKKRWFRDGFFQKMFLLITLPFNITWGFFVNIAQMFLFLIQDPRNAKEIIKETFLEVIVDTGAEIVETGAEVFRDPLNNFTRDFLVKIDPSEFPYTYENTVVLNETCNATFKHNISTTLFGLSSFKVEDFVIDDFSYRGNVMRIHIGGEIGSDGLKFEIEDSMSSLTNCSDGDKIRIFPGELQFEASIGLQSFLNLDVSMTGEVDDTGFNFSLTDIDFAELDIRGVENATVTITDVGNPNDQATVEIVMEDMLDEIMVMVNDTSSNPNGILEKMEIEVPRVFELPFRFPF